MFVIFLWGSHFSLNKKSDGSPASAMVARETSNLEAAGSSPALGSSGESSMSLCDLFAIFRDFSAIFSNTSHLTTEPGAWCS